MIIGLLKGLKVTFKYLFTRPITLKYPEERWEPYERFRGRHRLFWDEQKAREKCVACRLCERSCPVNCIRIEIGKDENNQRYPRVWELNLGRCIFCGYCVEACPVGAIEMTGAYELACYTKQETILNKEELLKTPQIPPPEVSKVKKIVKGE